MPGPRLVPFAAAALGLALLGCGRSDAPPAGGKAAPAAKPADHTAVVVLDVPGMT